MLKSNKLLILQFFIAIFLLELFVYLCAGVSFVQDDTYISLQYAKNLAEGNGLVFNIGERVEGFTSLLWVLLLSISYVINIDPVSYSKFLSIGFGYLTIISTYFLGQLLLQRFLNERKSVSKLILILLSLIPSLLLLFSGTFYYWSVSGMGSTLFSFLIITGIYLLIRELPDNKITLKSAIIFGIACLTRPEGIYITGLVLTIIALSNWNKPELNFKNALHLTFRTFGIKYIIVFLFPNLLLLFFRLIYYGYPLPNTFYAKTGFHLTQLYNGLNYFYSFLTSYMIYGLLFLLPIFLLSAKHIRKEWLILYGLTICYTLYIIFVGGDVLTLHRFFLPILPLIYVLILLSIIDLVLFFTSKWGFGKYSSFLVICIFALIIFNNFTSNSNYAKKRASRQNGLVHSMMGVGNWISNYNSDKENKLTIAASTVGALKYFSNSRVIDMLGLTDKYIAHNPEQISLVSNINSAWRERKYNAEYVLSNNPDFIVFSTKEKPSSFAERALFTKEDFLKKYYIFPIQLDTLQYPYNVYRLKEQGDIDKVSDLTQVNNNYSDEFVNLYNSLCNLRRRQNDKEKWDIFISLGYKLIEISPTYFNDHLRMLALSYYKNNEVIKAKEYAGLSLKNGMINIYSMALLYKIYLDEGNEDFAKDQLREIKRLNPHLIFNESLIN